jgi:uncharacterized membrane protein
MRRELWPLVVAAIIALLAVVSVGVPQSPPGLRAVIAVPFILIAPGYASSAALLPIGSIARAERLVISIGLSLAIAAIGGLVLHITPLGLRAEAWVALLGTLTIVSAVVAVLRWRPTPSLAGTSTFVAPTPMQSTAFVVALLLVGVALATAVTGKEGEPRPAFSQLWMVPAAGERTVTIGIGNQEQAPQRYLLEVSVGRVVVQSWADIELAPGAEWERDVELPALDDGSVVVGRLYLAEDANRPYREVTLRGPDG